jgi:hypothetical protein
MKFLSDIEVEQGADTTFVDNAKALFGNSSDLQIYHDGSNSYINESGTGSLFLQASDIFLKTNTSENAIACGNNGAVTLYYDNAAKLATTSAGVTVTGDLTVSGGDITLSGTGRIQGVDTVSATTDAANKAYVDAVNVGVTQITAGTNITISPSGGTGNVTINASGGGGGSGTINGSTVATRVAFGAASSTTEITSDPGLTYTSQNGLSVGDTTGSGNSIINMDKGSAGQSRIVMSETGTEKLSIKLDSAEESYITSVNKLTIATTGTTRDILIDSTGNVGIGDSTPSSTLSVDGGVQIGDDQATGVALASKVGTFRYHTDNPAGIFDYSYVDMCMQTDTATYEWVNIVTNRWER